MEAIIIMYFLHILGLTAYQKDLYKIIKTELGSKRNCNWVIFLNFINRELDRINEKLSENENINVFYKSKQTKFWIKKFININNKEL